ncbi:hypothetical protein FQA39_LY13602 [Lamprigera yunnana]|nr:hypothetical protein FQA39_LY13602 [Lamprigera yunnana]
MECAPDSAKLQEFLDYFVEQWMENGTIAISMWNNFGKRHRTNGSVKEYRWRVIRWPQMRLARGFTVAEAADYIEELLDNDSLPLCDEVDIFITPSDNDVQTDEDFGPEDSDGNINNLNSRQLAAQAEIQIRSLRNIIATSCEELKDKKKRTWIDGDLEAPKTAAFKESNYDNLTNCITVDHKTELSVKADRRDSDNLNGMKA